MNSVVLRLLLALCLLPIGVKALEMAPISATGYNRDVVVESTGSGPPFHGSAEDFNPGEGNAFYESGLPSYSYGLPPTRVFLSALGDGTTFELQPYTTNNVLLLSTPTGTAGTLTLVSPAPYKRLAILAASGSGGGAANLILNFTDNTSVIAQYSAPDWFFNPGYAISGMERISLSSGATQGAPDNPRFYQTTLDLEALLGRAVPPLASITFERAPANATGIFAISGEPLSETPVSISKQPVSQTVQELAPAQFSVTALGVPPPSYQWFRGAAALASQTNATLRIASAALSDNGAGFRVVVRNVAEGQTHSVTSSLAMLTVRADTNGPVLLSARTLGLSEVELSFNEPLDPVTASNLAAYSLTSSNTLSSATLDQTGTKVWLSVGTLKDGALYSISVTGLTDRAFAKNAVAPNSTYSFYALGYAPEEIGASALAGSIVPAGNGFNVSGSGSSSSSSSDQIHFSHQQRTGDFDVRVRLESLTLSDPWVEAGLSARASLLPTAETASVVATPSISGSYFAARTNPGGVLTRSGSFPANYPAMWLRLKREGNNFSGFGSRDGIRWIQLGSSNIAMPATVYFGFLVSSRNPEQLATAAFRDMSAVTNALVASSASDREPLGQSSRRTPLVISEIMYHPPDVPLQGRNARLEYIEIFNTLGEPQDLSGFRLTGDVSYTFPSGTRLPGGGFLLVARSPSDIQQVYGLQNAHGPWAGGETNGLPNNEGTVTLRHRTGAVLLKVDYKSVSPWPVAADGGGHSLVLVRPSFGENTAEAWDQSDRVLGSPGKLDPVTADPADPIKLNEILAHTDPPLEDFIELYNSGTATVSLAGYVLTDDPATNKFVIPAGTSLGPGSLAHFTQSTLGFALSSAGETLLLKTPDGSRVLDALRFDGQENAVAYGRWPNGARDWYRLATRSPGASNTRVLLSDVLINEVMYHPISGDDDLQYLELHNRANKAVDLTGWRFEDGIRYDFPEGTSLPANSYLVVARNANRLRAQYTHLNAANCLGDFSGTLSGKGERIALSKPDTIVSTNNAGVVFTNIINIPVDEVTYGSGGAWGRWSDGGGSSLELKDPRANRRLAANWADSEESTKAPWTLVEHQGVVDNGTTSADQLQVLLLGEGECLIDNIEVLDSNGANRIQNSTFESNATGWTAEGALSGSGWENTQGYNSSRSYRVRAVSRGDNQINRVRVQLTSPLSSGETATLRARVRWLKGHPEVILRLRGNWLEAAAPLNTPAMPGTPGLPNGRAVPNAAPSICEVAHSPAVPAANQPVLVSARIQDPDGVSSFTLKYRLDPNTSLTTVTLRDDGQAGDVLAGDGLFSALIPGQSAGTLVAYHLEAVDSAGTPAAGRYPAAAPADECLVRFGETTPTGNFPVYRLWITQANYNQWTSRSRLDNSPNSCTFVLGNDRVIHLAQGKFAGSPYISGGFDNPAGRRCGYSIDFPKDDLLLGGTALVLDWPGGHGNETTAIQEQMAYWMADQMNLPFSYRHFIRLHVNGVTDMQRLGVFEAVMQPSGDFLEQWSPGDADGDFFKIDRAFEFGNSGGLLADPMPRLQPFTTPDLVSSGLRKDVEKYRWTWLKRSYDRGLDYTNLLALVEALNSPGPEPYTSQTENLVDIPNWMGIFAFSHIINNFDSWGHIIGKNMYMYKPTQGKWQIYAFDLDWLMLVAPNGPGNYTALSTALFDCDDPTVTRMYNHPPFRRAYFQAVRNAVSSPLNAANCDPVMDAKYASLVANGITHCDGAALSTPAALKTWFAQRRSTLQGVLDSADAPLALSGPTTINSASNLVTITGTGPINLETLSINGVPYRLTWTTLSNWSASFPVPPGTSVLNLAGLDQNGTPLAGPAIQLTVVGPSQQSSPQSHLVFNEIMYSPSVPRAEYVELLNTSPATAFDLSGWQVNGLSYTFPPGSFIAPQQHLLLARDPSALITEHGSNAIVFDLFDGDLQPSGETLTLLRPDPMGPQPVTRIKYRNGHGWPSLPSRSGRALQLRQPTLDTWRPANWAALLPGAPSEPKWVQHTTTINAPSTTFYLYLGSAGEIYLDDVRLSQNSGSPNLLVNGDFEAPLTGSWTVSPNYAQSGLSTIIKRSGNSSLRLTAPAAGTGSGNSVSQTISGLPAGNYTLSFWYLQTTNGAPLVARFSGASPTAVNPAPPQENLAVATPGRANSALGVMAPFPTIWLNEVQAPNLSGITNSSGQRVAWIELFNPGNTSVDLSGFLLTHRETNTWSFPQGSSLLSRQFRVVFADGQTQLHTAAEWHASFNLFPGHGDVILSRITTNAQVQVLDALSYTNLPAGRSFGSYPDAQSFTQSPFFYATPGASNNPAAPPLTVSINEWMADNTRTLADPADNGFEDWFELYNYGAAPVDLGGYSLTDDPADMFQYFIPDNGQYVIPPGGFLLVWADGETIQNSTESADLHAPFRLSKDGDSIGLYGADGTVVDLVTFGPQTSDISTGRYPDGSTSVAPLPSPTPRLPNQGSNSAPVLPNIGILYVYSGQPLSYFAGAADPDSPPQVLTYSLEPTTSSGPQIASATGLITWTPGPAHVGTNYFTVHVVDNGFPPLSAQRPLHIHVIPSPQVTAYSSSPGQLTLAWTGHPSQTYRIQHKQRLEQPDWLPVGEDIQGTGVELQVQITISSGDSGFYRIVSLP